MNTSSNTFINHFDTKSIRRSIIIKKSYAIAFMLFLCLSCGVREVENELPAQTAQNDKEFKPDVIKNSTLIIVGKVKSLSTIGASNALINVSQVISGKIEENKSLVIVFNEKSSALENKELSYIFCLKAFPVKNKSSEEKTQWVQFTSTIPLSLAEATQANIDRVKKLLK